MRSTSTLFTVGTLLSRAQGTRTPVRVLVEGQWVSGTPVESDGHGVILDGAEGQFLVRLDAISVVAYARTGADGPTVPDVNERAPWEQPAPEATAPRQATPHQAGQVPSLVRA